MDKQVCIVIACFSSAYAKHLNCVSYAFLELIYFFNNHVSILIFSSLLGTQLRLFASVSNGRKGGKNNGTVNKNNAKAKKLTQGDDEPPLTIYPFSINDLQKPQNKAKPNNKDNAKTSNQTHKPGSACKIEKKPIFTPNLVTSPILTNKTETMSADNSETSGTFKTESQASKTETNSPFKMIKTVSEASKVEASSTEVRNAETTLILQSCKISEQILNKSATKSGKSTDKRELDAEKRIQAIVIQNKFSFC